MCGRYVTPDEAALNSEYRVDRTNSHLRAVDALDALYEPNFNASPTDPVPIVRVVRHVQDQRESVLMRWGLIPYWTNGEPIPGRNTINARIETFRTNGTFGDAWKKQQRCLVPVMGFYEWQAQPPDWQRTVPFYITLADQKIYSLAGLWDRSEKQGGTVIESVTVITMPANELLKSIHNSTKAGGRRALLSEHERRMPAIIARGDEEVWLRGSAEEAFAVLKQYPSETMVAWPVSDRVNSVKNDGPDLIQPIDIAPPSGTSGDLFA